MQPDLKRLINDLRQETCPQKVLDEVQRRTATKTSISLQLRFAICLTAAVLVLAGGLLEWQREAGADRRASLKLAERTRIARQTEAALGFMGSLLAQAGTDSGKIISNRAATPLQNSFQTTKNKIIQPLDL